MPRDIRQWADFAFSFHEGLPSHRMGQDWFSIAPIQIRSEFLKFLAIVERRKPTGVLEIGTSHGGSLFLLCRVAAADAALASVDLPRDSPHGGYPRWRELLYQTFPAPSQSLHLIRMDSHTTGCLDRVRATFRDQGVDVLFIDGDHSYEGVSKDFELYGPLVRPGGIVAFHDIVPDYGTRYGIDTPVFSGGVPEFWREVRETHSTMEIVEDPEQNGFGIGVLFADSEEAFLAP